MAASLTHRRMAAPAQAPPTIGVGTWAWGNQFLWGYDPEQDERIHLAFERAVELGLRFFDTADSYGTGRWAGRSETLLGNWCAALPPERQTGLTLATKLAPFPWRLGKRGFDRAWEASRRRLRGKLDRVQLHWSTARYAPWQEGPLLQGLADRVLAGDVAEIGVSNFGPLSLRQVHARLAEQGVRLTSLQVQFSLLAPQAAAVGGVAQVCRELGIEFIAYSPLALGWLAPRDGESSTRPRGPRGALFARLDRGAAALRQGLLRVAATRGVPAAAVSLNWCRAHGAMPIPGLRRVNQVEEAAAALTWTLSDEERGELDRLAFANAVRMPANPFQSA
ncbi:MAG: aldo/keto reductase [Cyanobacteriota bacterium]|nr:aldo/keto reductase [Cyanobacteriota bacterium]